MDAQRLDALAKRMATTAPRRGILQGLGALGVGSLVVLGLTEVGSAQVEAESCRSKCQRRCRNRNKGGGCKKRCIRNRC
jgi:hypothetical protein